MWLKHPLRAKEIKQKSLELMGFAKGVAANPLPNEFSDFLSPPLGLDRAAADLGFAAGKEKWRLLKEAAGFKDTHWPVSNRKQKCQTEVLGELMRLSNYATASAAAGTLVAKFQPAREGTTAAAGPFVSWKPDGVDVAGDPMHGALWFLLGGYAQTGPPRSSGKDRLAAQHTENAEETRNHLAWCLSSSPNVVMPEADLTPLQVQRLSRAIRCSTWPKSGRGAWAEVARVLRNTRYLWSEAVLRGQMSSEGEKAPVGEGTDDELFEALVKSQSMPSKIAGAHGLGEAARPTEN